jgi:hypothetical protein
LPSGFGQFDQVTVFSPFGLMGGPGGLGERLRPSRKVQMLLLLLLQLLEPYRRSWNLGIFDFWQLLQGGRGY